MMRGLRLTVVDGKLTVRRALPSTLFVQFRVLTVGWLTVVDGKNLTFAGPSACACACACARPGEASLKVTVNPSTTVNRTGTGAGGLDPLTSPSQAPETTLARHEGHHTPGGKVAR